MAQTQVIRILNAKILIFVEYNENVCVTRARCACNYDNITLTLQLAPKHKVALSVLSERSRLPRTRICSNRATQAGFVFCLPFTIFLADIFPGVINTPRKRYQKNSEKKTMFILRVNAVHVS